MDLLPEPTCLHHFFERQAARVPDAIAVEHRELGRTLTYRELDERSREVAEMLRARGVGADDRVALYVQRGIELYVAMLGVLRAGAAYVPIDAQHPEERVRFLLEDSGTKVVIATRERGRICSAAGFTVINVEDFAAEAAATPKNDAPFPTPQPEHLAYIIYTSGTTGQPKGVCLSHLNAVTFVKAMLEVYGVREDDRILQGFSTAFDASLEEIWMAFAHGATLVVGTLETMRAVDELADKLRDYDITILSTVPTLLRVVDSERLPRLRMVIAGGEAARADIVDRWATPARRMMNSYGPTETTVVCTYSWCVPGEPVTIGGPLPGYEAAIVDDELRDVPDGTEGELVIGGPAVSLRGYLHRPELTGQKFFDRNGVRFYRTGDLVRRENDKIFYLARIDAQVKVRGYRVELEEVETHLARQLEITPGGQEIQGAIVALREENGVPELVAYLLCSLEPEYLDLRSLIAAMRKKVPPYMVPSHFAWLDPKEVPRLTSGKIDRRRLPPLSTCQIVPEPSAVGRVRTVAEEDAGLSEEERQILGVWRSVLHTPTLGADDSFFDLGGNSILAGQSVSQFRKSAALALLSIRDIYQLPTARTLAIRLRERANERAAAAERGAEGGAAPPAHEPYVAPRGQYLACVTAQTLVLLSLFAIGAYTFYFLLRGGINFAQAYPWYLSLAVVFGASIVFFLVPFVIALLGRVLLGSVREGDYPLWSWGYFKWWFHGIAFAGARGVAGGMLGTPLAGFFYRLVGARVGRAAYLSSPIDDPELITIGDNVSISEETVIRTHAIEGGILKLRHVHIGNGVFIGAQSIVGGGVRMGENSKLHPLSCLVEGTVTPPNSEWRGSPAAQIQPGTTALSGILRKIEEEAHPHDGWLRPRNCVKVVFWQTLIGYLTGIASTSIYVLQMWLLVLLGALQLEPFGFDLGLLVAMAIPFTTLRVVEQVFFLVAEKWIVSGRARPGTITLGSFEYVRRWYCHGLMNTVVSPTGLRGFTETLLIAPLLRLVGMKIGKRSELADAVGFQPDLVTIGSGAMLADRCVIGVPVVHRGRMVLGEIKIGDKSFVANAAHHPITTPELRSGSLVGVLSIPPDDPPPASDWLGSPPMRLPNRTRRDAPEALTFQPPKKMVAARLFFNFWKIVLPGSLLEILGWVAFWAMLTAEANLSFGVFLAVLPAIFLGYEIALLLLPIALKWVIIGRYQAGERYLWSFWMWRSEIVYELELLVLGTAGQLLNQTPYLALWYRLMGAKIGKQACLQGGAVMEADLIEIGEHVSIEGFLQTHLFEDRVMKLGRVTLRDACTVMREGCVLYDSTMGEKSVLGDLSLIMKHETFLPNRKYRGLPAENVHDGAARSLPPPPGESRAA